MNEIKTILKESLSGIDNKYSSKKLSMALCLWTAIFMSLFDLFNSGFKMEVFNSLLVVGIGLSTVGTIANNLTKK